MVLHQHPQILGVRNTGKSIGARQPGFDLSPCLQQQPAQTRIHAKSSPPARTLGNGLCQGTAGWPRDVPQWPRDMPQWPRDMPQWPRDMSQSSSQAGGKGWDEALPGQTIYFSLSYHGSYGKEQPLQSWGGCRNVGSPEEACGAVQRQARSRVCRHQPVGQAAPSPVGLGFAAQPKSTETLGWLSPFRGANPEASCPSRLSHPPFCTSPLLSTAANSHRDQIHSYGRVNLPGRPPPALGREEGYSPLGLEDAFPQTWGMLPPMGLLQVATHFMHHPSPRRASSPPDSPKAQDGVPVSPPPPTPRRRPLPGPACVPAVPGAPARAAGTCSSGGP